MPRRRSDDGDDSVQVEPVGEAAKLQLKELLSSRKPITDFPELAETVAGLLQSGYSNSGVCGEFLLTDAELLILKESCPTDWWARNQVGSERWLSRKIANKLTKFGPDDMAIIQAKDKSFNPRRDELPQGNTYNILVFNGDRKGIEAPNPSVIDVKQE